VIIFLAHYVTFAHILGGFFMTIGMFTRAACLIQIPIMIGAIIFVNFTPAQDALQPYSELFLSVSSCSLLIYFLIVVTALEYQVPGRGEETKPALGTGLPEH
jgi:uncharacterized membrane protein YphA (DoxX/SURF4 family)